MEISAPLVATSISSISYFVNLSIIPVCGCNKFSVGSVDATESDFCPVQSGDMVTINNFKRSFAVDTNQISG
jgi:hypothetical protein